MSKQLQPILSKMLAAKQKKTPVNGKGRNGHDPPVLWRPFDDIDEYVPSCRQQLEVERSLCPSHPTTDYGSIFSGIQYPCWTSMAEKMASPFFWRNHRPPDISVSRKIFRPWENNTRRMFSSFPRRLSVFQRSRVCRTISVSSELEETRNVRQSSTENSPMKDNHSVQQNGARRAFHSFKVISDILVDDISTSRHCSKMLPISCCQRDNICRAKQEGKYRCPVCCKACLKNKALKNHMKTHMGQKPYKCKFCVASFADRSTKTKHERIHTGDTPYVCPKCGRGFTGSGNLYRHMDNKHGEATTQQYRLKKKQKMCKQSSK